MEKDNLPKIEGLKQSKSTVVCGQQCKAETQRLTDLELKGDKTGRLLFNRAGQRRGDGGRRKREERKKGAAVVIDIKKK